MEGSMFGKLEELDLDGLAGATWHLDHALLDCMGCWFEAVVGDVVEEKRRLEVEILKICDARRSLRIEVEARQIIGDGSIGEGVA